VALKQHFVPFERLRHISLAFTIFCQYAVRLKVAPPPALALHEDTERHPKLVTERHPKLVILNVPQADSI
jgi:hypothetical protein